MKSIVLAIILRITIFGVALSEKVQFDNFRVYSVRIDKLQDFEILQQLENQHLGYQILNRPAVGYSADVLVPPHKLPDFHKILVNFNLVYLVKTENLQQLSL